MYMWPNIISTVSMLVHGMVMPRRKIREAEGSPQQEARQAGDSDLQPSKALRASIFLVRFCSVYGTPLDLQVCWTERRLSHIGKPIRRSVLKYIHINIHNITFINISTCILHTCYDTAPIFKAQSFSFRRPKKQVESKDRRVLRYQGESFLPGAPETLRRPY